MGDGYTHDPEAFDEDGEVVDPEPVEGKAASGGRESDRRAGASASTHPSTAERTFDWRGWVLVAAIAVCFLVIPAVILAYPYVGQQFGLSFYDTYLALPMIPAVVLAALAVWATTRP